MHITLFQYLNSLFSHHQDFLSIASIPNFEFGIDINNIHIKILDFTKCNHSTS